MHWKSAVTIYKMGMFHSHASQLHSEDIAHFAYVYRTRKIWNKNWDLLYLDKFPIQLFSIMPLLFLYKLTLLITALNIPLL